MTRLILALAVFVLAAPAYSADGYGFRYSANDLQSASSTKSLLREIEQAAIRECQEEEVGNARDACKSTVVNDIVGRIDDDRLTKYAARKH